MHPDTVARLAKPQYFSDSSLLCRKRPLCTYSNLIVPGGQNPELNISGGELSQRVKGLMVIVFEGSEVELKIKDQVRKMKIKRNLSIVNTLFLFQIPTCNLHYPIVGSLPRRNTLPKLL